MIQLVFLKLEETNRFHDVLKHGLFSFLALAGKESLFALLIVWILLYIWLLRYDFAQLTHHVRVGSFFW